MAMAISIMSPTLLRNAIIYIFVEFVIAKVQFHLAEYELRRHLDVDEEPHEPLRSAIALAIVDRCGTACMHVTCSGRAAVRNVVAAVVVDDVDVDVDVVDDDVVAY